MSHRWYRKWINNQCPKNGEPLNHWSNADAKEIELHGGLPIFCVAVLIGPSLAKHQPIPKEQFTWVPAIRPPQKICPKWKQTHQISKFHAANSEKTSTLSKQQTVYLLYRYTETWDARCNFTSQRFMSSCSSWEIPGAPKINVSKGLRKKNTCFICFPMLLN